MTYNKSLLINMFHSNKPFQSMKDSIILLLPVLLQSHTQLRHEIDYISRKFNSSNPVELQVRVEEMLRKHIQNTRENLYKVMKSEDFINQSPEARGINELEISDFRKAVLILLYIEVDIQSICHILLSEKESIATILSLLKKSYPDFF